MLIFTCLDRMNSEIEILKGLHPGIVVEQKLKERGLKKGQFALSIGEYPQVLGDITKGKRKMNISLSLKIEKKLELEEGFLMILQVYYDIKQERRIESQILSHPDLSKLRRGLFWDTDISKIDWQRQKRAVIERIFERGNDQEKSEISRFYGETIIQKIIGGRTSHA